MRQPLFCYGGPSGDRTLDTLIKSQVLCQLSYWSMFCFSSYSLFPEHM